MERLTKSEEQLMNLFWDEGTPLTSVDIVRLEIKDTWGNGLVSNMLRALLKKGCIKEVGLKHYTTQYAREFLPALTREEYAAKVVTSVAGEKLSIAKIMLALIKENENKEEIIKDLEDIIRDLKAES